MTFALCASLTHGIFGFDEHQQESKHAVASGEKAIYFVELQSG